MRKLLHCLSIIALMPIVSHADEAELTGFITSNVVSRTGHDFYRFFSERINESVIDFNLSIRERPDARWGSLIWIEYQGSPVYRSFLQPSGSDIKKAAYDAADNALTQIQQARVQALFEDTFDMGRDELNL